MEKGSYYKIRLPKGGLKREVGGGGLNRAFTVFYTTYTVSPILVIH